MLVPELVTFQLHVDAPGDGVYQLGLCGLDHGPGPPGRQSDGGQHHTAPRLPAPAAEVDKAASAGERVVTREYLSRQSGQSLDSLSPGPGDILTGGSLADIIIRLTDGVILGD